MVSAIATKFGSNGFVVKNPRGLDLDSLRERCPSVFADAKHHSRSERYSQVKTIDVLSAFRDNGFMATEIRQSGSRVEGKQEFGKHLIRFRQLDSNIKVGDVYPELILVNSHDGSSSYKLSSGWFRLACSNGLCYPVSEHSCIDVRHSGNVDDVIDASFTVVKNFEQQANSVETMARIGLDRKEQTLFAETALSLKVDEPSSFDVQRVLATRRSEDAKPDLWTTFNVVQENIIGGGKKVKGRKMRPVNGIDENVKLNRAMWMLAEKFAQLKG